MTRFSNLLKWNNRSFDLQDSSDWLDLFDDLGPQLLRFLLATEYNIDDIPEDDSLLLELKKQIKDFPLADFKPKHGSVWILFAFKENLANLPAPFRKDGILLPFEWRTGEEVTQHSSLLPQGLTELADKVKQQFGEKAEMYYLYPDSIFQDRVDFSMDGVGFSSGWGALASGLYLALNPKAMLLEWPFSSIQFDFEKGEMDAVGHLEEKIILAASFNAEELAVAPCQYKEAVKILNIVKAKNPENKKIQKMKIFLVKSSGNIDKTAANIAKCNQHNRQWLIKIILFCVMVLLFFFMWNIFVTNEFVYANKYIQRVKGIVTKVDVQVKQKEIDKLLLAAETAKQNHEWEDLAEISKKIMLIDSANSEAKKFLDFALFKKSENEEMLLDVAIRRGVIFSKDKTILLKYPKDLADADFTIPSCVTTIGEGAFRDNRNLVRITIPTTVKYIEKNAFRDSSIVIIDIRDGVEYIATGAFMGCDNLVSLSIPGSVKKIAADTFSGWSLNELIISEGVETIEADAFNLNETTTLFLPKSLIFLGENNFKESKNINLHPGNTNFVIENGILWDSSHCRLVKDLSSSRKKYTVPLHIKSIDAFAFANSDVECIFIPENVEKIGKGAFKNCKRLSKVTLPKSLTVLPEDLFNGCISLKDLRCSNKIKYVLKGAFENCKTLNFTFPDELEEIFPDNLDYIKNFSVPNGHKNYVLKNGILFNKSLSKLIWCDKNITTVSIPNSVTEIGTRAFAKGKIEEIYLPDSVKKISEAAFWRANLKRISIPTGVVEIEKHVFEESKLSHIHIPSSVKKISDDAFKGAKLLSQLSFEDGVEEIACGAFWGCDSLKSVTLPPSIILLGAGCFGGCENLKQIIVQGRLTKIPNKAFRWCNNLEKIILPDSVINIGEKAFYECKKLQDIKLPEHLIAIGNGCFSGCVGLKYIDMPDTVQTLGDEVFAGCNNLSRVKLSKNLNFIPKRAFYRCSQLSKLSIPQGIKYIDDESLAECKISYIEIPSSVKRIGHSAFARSELEHIKLSEGLETLEELCFSYSKLKKIILPNSLLRIGNQAFRGSKLITLHIPKNVKEIGGGFLAWTGDFSNGFLLSVSPANQSFVLDDGILFSKDRKILIHYPRFNIIKHNSPQIVGGAKVSDLPSANSSFYKGLCYTIPDGVEIIAAGAFDGNDGLVDIKLPNSLKIIEKDAFANSCIREIHFSSNLKWIGDNAFHDTALSQIIIPGTINYIGEAVFSDCKFLTNVTIEKGITNIRFRTFYHCKALNKVTVPITLKFIDNECFRLCQNLKNINLTSLEIIGDSAFYHTAIRECIFSNKLQHVGSFSFSDCHGLRKLTIPEGVLTLGMGAFSNCSGIKTVNIKSPITVSHSLFENCINLQDVFLSPQVLYIEREAFGNCNNLQSINLSENISIKDDSFKNTPVEGYINDKYLKNSNK